MFLISLGSAGPSICLDPGEGGAGARFNNPYGVLTTSDGTKTYVVDTYNHAIRVYENNGVYTLAGGGNNPDGIPQEGDLDGPVSSALFKWPRAIAFDVDGNLLIVDSGYHKIKKLDLSTMIVTTIAGGNSGGGTPCSGTNPNIDGAPACINGQGTQARFYFPSGIAVNTNNGNIFVADTNNHRIRKIDPNQNYKVTVLVGNGETSGPTQGWRNEVSLSVIAPQDIEYHKGVNGQFNLYYVHGGGVHNTQRIYYDASHNGGDYYMGHFSCQLNNPGFVDGTSGSCKNDDPKGLSIINSNIEGFFKIYLADYDNHAIRDITSSGTEGTYSGGNGEGSMDGTSQDCTAGSIPNSDCTGSISKPRDTSVDLNDNVYLTGEDHLLRKVTPSASYPDGDMLTTLAGSAGVPGFVDCVPSGGCGDGACNGNEDCNSCSIDCGACSLPQCNNGIDDDVDGFIDYPEDIGCTSLLDNDETNPQCSDGIDNDGDLLIDFGNDPGCLNQLDDSEDDTIMCDNDGILEPSQGEQCDDGDMDPNDFCNNCELTFCGDGFIQRPNGGGTGGPNNDGFEECDDRNTDPNDQCNNCVLNVGGPREWRDMNDFPIITADAGDTVKLFYSGGASLGYFDFIIREDDGLGDDDVATITGSDDGSGNAVATWIVPTGIIGKEEETSYNLYYEINGDDSWELEVNTETVDDPIEGNILDPLCASDFAKGTNKQIRFHLEDPDNEFTLIEITVDEGNGNGPQLLFYDDYPSGSEGDYITDQFTFDFAGTSKIALRAENSRGKKFLAISNVMVTDGDGDYVAACIDEPSNLYIGGDYAHFDASASKGIRISQGFGTDYTLPDGTGNLKLYWTFSDGRINPDNNGNNLISYHFKKYFGQYGDNWGNLVVELI